MSYSHLHEFREFFEALNGHPPFPWQQRLLSRILETLSWPKLLDIPTGLGKTSTIDVALFLLAVRPDIAPRRIVMVVDRRVVVDQAAEHARRLQQRLGEAKEGSLARVARSLRLLWTGLEDEAPFEVAVLRGGMPRDEAWAHRPDRPVVAVSTVDQVGSRLLFRGYGVSATMAPIHAGLLGQDVLLLLDEVQLSTAFAETLRALEERWRSWREGPQDVGASAGQVPDRWAFVRMSATPVGDELAPEHRFRLDSADQAHPIVKKRIDACKLAALALPVATSKSDAEKGKRALVEAFAAEALSHLGAGARRVAVIVNRVATARWIHQGLQECVQGRADVVLLTGRMRPLDRGEVFGVVADPSSVAARVTAGQPRSSDSRPVVVVATQTIEAGADFDFDALVTECASLDALRQRFGRLNRRGELAESRATILVRKDQAASSEEDPIYGAALANTWRWLESRAGSSRSVDFGISGFPSLPDDPLERAALCSPVSRAPVMLPAHIDAWAQTSPRGEPDPEVALWLHGPRRGLAEVRVVWRADVDEEALADESRQPEVEEYVQASLAAAPPSSLEAISIPLAAFRAWVTQRSAVDVADVEGASGEPLDLNSWSDDVERVRPFLLVEKAGAKIQRNIEGLYPEATIVVPACYGGIRCGNWDPQAGEPVRDKGDWAQLLHRGRPVLRIVPEVLASQFATSARADESAPLPSAGAWWQPRGGGLHALIVPTAAALEDSGMSSQEAILEWLAQARDQGAEALRSVVSALLEKSSGVRVLPLGGSGFFAVVGQRLRSARLATYGAPPDVASHIVNDDNDDACYVGQELGLEPHLRDVERWLRTFAGNLGLPEPLAHDLALAARLHDLGKADPRFQQMLHGGSLVRMAASGVLLAKSRADAASRAARELARTRAEYPDGYRHELLSVVMLEGNPAALATAFDRDLVLHLVGSHHGWCRPFAPAVGAGAAVPVRFSFDGVEYATDTAHDLARVGSPVAERYWRLTERYGWWRLAWFEALVRLADHRASEESSIQSSVAAGGASKRGTGRLEGVASA